EPARALLREYLGADATVEVVGEAPNGFDAVRLAGELRPDLLLLDIQMPKLDGFEALELIGDGPEVVFITAHDEHALRAFAVHAVDYLLKPVTRERLLQVLERTRRRIEARGEALPPPETGAERRPVATALAAAARGPGRFLERIVVRDGARIHVIAVASVDAIEAEDDYVRIHSAGKSWL